MPELITLGETMAVFSPSLSGPLRYHSDYRMRFAGAESNTAIGLQKLGHSSAWVSRLGDDEFGHFLCNSIRAEGVDTSRVLFDSDHRTGIMFKETTFNRDTKVYYYRENSAASHLSPDDVDPAFFAESKVIHLTGITPVLSDSCSRTVLKIVEQIKGSHQLLSFDPNIRLKLWKDRDYRSVNMEILRQSDIISCGVDEAELLFNLREPDRIFEYLFENTGASYIAIKNGSKGSFVANREKSVSVPPTKWVRVDAVGAGDAFNAGFLAGILEGQPIEICGRMANIMGGLATQTLGDTEGLPSRTELDQYLNDTKIIFR